MGTETPQPNRSPLAGQAKVARKVRLTVPQWDALIREANDLGVPLAEHLRRVVDNHLHHDAADKRAATRFRSLEKRMTNVEAKINELSVS